MAATPRPGRRALLSAGVAGLGLAAPALAQQNAFPERPVTLVVPFPPGGSTDVMARLLAERMAPSLSQPVLVEHRPGAAVAEVAEELQVAANTVSTLVRELEAAGLLERRRGRADRRVTELHLTTAAHERLADWGGHRQEVLEEVLGDLPAADREALAAALPALERLREALAMRAGLS